MFRRGQTLSIIIALLCGNAEAEAQKQPASETIDQSLALYASTAHSARLPGGRTIHLTCSGSGNPTVILTAGLGGWGIDWSKVQPTLSAKTRVCAWDRAGWGLSGYSPEAQTVKNTTLDLERALEAVGIAGPYVMVGHSLGSYESLRFTDRHRRDVVGMVLVDPSFPNQAVRMKQAAPAIYALAPPTDQDPLVVLFRKCAKALRSGTVVRGGPDPDGCLRPPPPPETYPAPLRTALLAQMAEPDGEKIARTMGTLASSLSSFDKSGRMVVSRKRNYGDMPLTVLTATTFRWPPNASAEARAELPARQAMWRQGHDELAALSSRGSNRLIADSGHFIQQEQPRAVIDAVEEVIDQSRKRQTRTSEQ